MKVRALNSDGIAVFEGYLKRIDAGAIEAPPRELLTDQRMTEGIEGDAEVEDRKFVSRQEMAAYLAEALKGIDRNHLDASSGLWSWLALNYFDQLCPPDQVGRREPKREYMYVLPARESVDYHRHAYRHLLAGPYWIYRIHKDNGRMFLYPPVHTHPDFAEQIASRMEYITNTELVGAMDRLYFDSAQLKPKRGGTNRKKKGTLRRFLAVMDQLDLTFDLYSLTREQVIALLPGEFDVWKGKDGSP